MVVTVQERGDVCPLFSHEDQGHALRIVTAHVSLGTKDTNVLNGAATSRSRALALGALSRWRGRHRARQSCRPRESPNGRRCPNAGRLRPCQPGTRPSECVLSGNVEGGNWAEGPQFFAAPPSPRWGHHPPLFGVFHPVPPTPHGGAWHREHRKRQRCTDGGQAPGGAQGLSTASVCQWLDGPGTSQLRPSLVTLPWFLQSADPSGVPFLHAGAPREMALVAKD